MVFKAAPWESNGCDKFDALHSAPHQSHSSNTVHWNCGDNSLCPNCVTTSTAARYYIVPTNLSSYVCQKDSICKLYQKED